MFEVQNIEIVETVLDDVELTDGGSSMMRSSTLVH